GDTAALLQRLSQFDIFLDSATFLPVAVAFNIHPDNNALLDIPVEIRYSDYRSVGSGVGPNVGPGFSLASSPQAPFHIEKFLNGSLSLDLQFSTVTLNSGLTAADFSL